MIINHNMNAMNAHRLMTGNTAGAGKSMEKLSSGLRINRAGDDAAGLAISEKMRGQIRGLDQASRNSQDGISMIQTAEGALNETHSILQRMRELAVQAGNDTNVTVDRQEIQKEINQLSSEINRIGNTTEFNKQKILKGGDGTATVAGTGVTLAAKVGAGTLGSADVVTQATVTDTAASFGAKNSAAATFHIGGVDIKLTADSTLTKAQGTVSADGKTIVIGSKDLTTTSVAAAAEIATELNKAIANNDSLRGKYTVTAAGAGTGKFTISAVAGSDADGAAGNITATTAGGAITAGTVTNGKVTAGNTASTGNISFAGVTDASTLVGKGFTVGDTTIEFYDAAQGAYSGNGIGVDIHNAANGADVVKDMVSQVGDKLKDVRFTQGTATSDLVISAKDRGTAGNDILIRDGGSAKDFTATLQVGANKDQSFGITIKDMRANALGITAAQGTSGFTSNNTVSNGTSSTSVEAALDVSSYTSATSAIDVINNAIEKVSAERSKLGAMQNRLEHTINNLGTSSENLTAAESRIRDVDMAKEMMNFSKNNILSQAAQAMLAQANQQPQGVLQLLR